MADLIEIGEIPGYRLIDAYDITRLVNAINSLYQGSTSVRIVTALTIEMGATDNGIIVAPLVNSTVTIFLKSAPVLGTSCFVKDGNSAGTFELIRPASAAFDAMNGDVR